jgi:hypothetical protein
MCYIVTQLIDFSRWDGGLLQTSFNSLEDLFLAAKKRLPGDLLASEEAIVIDSLLRCFNDLLSPRGVWILVNGDMTLLELLSDAAAQKPVKEKNQ